MAPIYREFMNDNEVVAAVERIKGEVSEDNIYVLSHDRSHTSHVAERADANTVGMSETGFGVQVKNVFRKKGDELRAKFEELGFSAGEADTLEAKLDKGAVVVVIQDPPSGLSI
ncbi:general stress protein [Natribacillus halophilus]|uniref:Heat induced stress protein YflT n=1 Tax=Natribacillus halophilus TaxID=549003 RepID=A0A1G8R2N4_9BACI|nr:general stress protein [Natribacillus halophilus]SDJ10815.1 Heat induced stress protein YflT [Natribacillus halophilus]